MHSMDRLLAVNPQKEVRELAVELLDDESARDEYFSLPEESRTPYGYARLLLERFVTRLTLTAHQPGQITVADMQLAANLLYKDGYAETGYRFQQMVDLWKKDASD